MERENSSERGSGEGSNDTTATSLPIVPLGGKNSPSNPPSASNSASFIANIRAVTGSSNTLSHGTSGGCLSPYPAPTVLDRLAAGKVLAGDDDADVPPLIADAAKDIAKPVDTLNSSAERRRRKSLKGRKEEGSENTARLAVIPQELSVGYKNFKQFE